MTAKRKPKPGPVRLNEVEWLLLYQWIEEHQDLCGEPCPDAKRIKQKIGRNGRLAYQGGTVGV